MLAIEVAGADDSENEEALRVKASWYFAHGVPILWLVLPEAREVVVLRPGNETRLGDGDLVPEQPELPGLEVPVAELFSTI